MADTAVVTPVKKTPKKKTTKPKVPAAHPKYSEMVITAINALKERGGSSRAAILKYIIANFSVGSNATTVNTHLKLALKSGVTKGSLKQSKGTGATGSFKIGEAPKVAKPKAKKVAAKKDAKPKKVTTKKPKAKTPKKKPSVKKTTKPTKKVKTPKKAAKKTPKKAKPATKPKTKKPAVKKTAAKK